MLRAFPLSAQDSPGALWRVERPWHTVVAWTRANQAPVGGDLLALARAELALGRTARAWGLLERDAAGTLDTVRVFALRGAIEARGGNSAAAAGLFSVALRHSAGPVSGVLAARAAAAYEAAGARDSAAALYARARAWLPEIADWLALREARVVADSSTARVLLSEVPVAAGDLVLEVRGRWRLAAGDTAGAIPLLAGAGRVEEACRLARARGDGAGARRIAFDALLAPDTARVRAARRLVPDAFPPTTASEWLAAAQGAGALGDPDRAARFAARAIALGDTSVATLLSLGGWLEQDGRRREALKPYALAGDAGVVARARTLNRLGERGAAIAALRAFVARSPENRSAPYALYLAADLASSDSLLEAVATRWPTGGYASAARVRLAASSLAARDTVGAIRFYQAEVEVRGPQSALARYYLGRLRLAQGDEEVGLVALRTLAHDDSIGYYGTLARREADLPPLRLAGPPPHATAPAVADLLTALDLLDAAGFTAEAARLVAYGTARTWQEPEEVLDLADGLIARGRSIEGIRLGWRAAERLSLNDPRVLRAIFPWPNRSLIEAEAEKFDVDPYLLTALIRQESSFAAAVQSAAGAVGYMQLMPATARGLAQRLRVPWTDQMATVADASLHLGTAHLAALLSRYEGNVPAALAAYNAGGRPVARWLRAEGGGDPVRFVEAVTYRETQGFLRAVLRFRVLYRALYPPAEATDR